MSLDKLLKNQPTSSKSATPHVKLSNIELYLPPEYELSDEEWKSYFTAYNQFGRPTKTADAICHYIREHNPNSDTKALYSVSNVICKDSSFYTDVMFGKSKPALTALLFYKAEHLRFVPILTVQKDAIQHIVLTYVPD